MMAVTALAAIQLRELIRALTKLHTSPRVHKKFDFQHHRLHALGAGPLFNGKTTKKNTQVVDLVTCFWFYFSHLAVLAIFGWRLPTDPCPPVISDQSAARPLFLIRRINFLSLVFRRPPPFGDFGGDRDSINSYLHKDIHVLQAAAALAAVLREENQSFLFSVFPPHFLFFKPTPAQLLNICARFGHHHHRHHHLRLMHI